MPMSSVPVKSTLKGTSELFCGSLTLSATSFSPGTETSAVLPLMVTVIFAGLYLPRFALVLTRLEVKTMFFLFSGARRYINAFLVLLSCSSYLVWHRRLNQNGPAIRLTW